MNIKAPQSKKNPKKRGVTMFARTCNLFFNFTINTTPTVNGMRIGPNRSSQNMGAIYRNLT